MARSNILGGDEVPVLPPGHDTSALGPSDSSDSGSDLAGIAAHDAGDPGLPVDVATRDESPHPTTVAESVRPGADSDAAGTGERRSVSGDAGIHEAADIGPDEIVPRPGSDVPVDDNSPIFEDFPATENEEDLPEDSDSPDYGNAVFSGAGEVPAHRKRKRKTPTA